MADRWLKTNCLLASAIALWLSALSPIPRIAKGISYSLALIASVQLVNESRRLIRDESRRAALRSMNQELEQLEIVLHTQGQEQALYEMYATCPPEVKEELTKSLEHLYTEPSAETYVDTSASTFNRKAFYLSVKSLLEVHPPTYVVEQILGYRGRKFNEGNAILQDLLDEGDRNEW